jgi:hypothetical protein
MKRKTLEYITPDGMRYPLTEATFDFSIKVYKSDCRKAKIADPERCLIALGARRNRLVESAYIGSGKSAYVIFKAFRGKPAHAVHFTLNAQASRVRDFFDSHQGVTSQTITLSAVTAGRTRAHRAELNRRRAKLIKTGEHVVKPQAHPGTTRIMRLGVAHRPKARIEDNTVSVSREAAA